MPGRGHWESTRVWGSLGLGEVSEEVLTSGGDTWTVRSVGIIQTTGEAGSPDRGIHRNNFVKSPYIWKISP